MWNYKINKQNNFNIYIYIIYIYTHVYIIKKSMKAVIGLKFELLFVDIVADPKYQTIY